MGVTSKRSAIVATALAVAGSAVVAGVLTTGAVSVICMVIGNACFLFGAYERMRSPEWYERTGWFVLFGATLVIQFALASLSFKFTKPGSGHLLLESAWVANFVVMVVALVRASSHTRMMKKRAAEGRCLVCGYDLRESPERCPECGAARGPASSPAGGQGG